MITFNLKPRYYFGDTALEGLSIELKRKKFKKAYIIYGQNSIKENKIYDEIIDILHKENLNYAEFEGIEPNPKDSTILKAIEHGEKNEIDLIIAVGGGSVIDASKVIATLITNKNKYPSVWDYVTNPKNLGQLPIPIISIITLAGTASENNACSVITNDLKKWKASVMQPYAIPYVAIVNPKYTFTVNEWQTASGIFDCFSHLLEQFFGKETFGWTKEIIYANLKVLWKYGRIVLKEPTNYEARANILWTTTMSLNGITSFNSDSDWTVHLIEHAFSGIWNITHGAGLALITPIYLEVRAKREQWFCEKLNMIGKELFNTTSISETINLIKNFILSLNLPLKWNQFKEIIDFTSQNETDLLEHIMRFGGTEEYKEMYQEIITKIKENV